MFRIPTTNTVTFDNTVVINGQTMPKISDALTEKIYSMIMGEQSMSTPIVNAPQNNYVASDNTTKPTYVADKDFVPKYEIKEQTSVNGTKLYCISRANGWTKAEKSLMNGSIKALKGIIEVDVEYIKDGKKRTFKAWGYKTESTAKKHLKELPTVFTVAQLNGVAK